MLFVGLVWRLATSAGYQRLQRRGEL